MSVKSAPFNAKGDGIADDTRAFTAAKAASNTIHLPPGVYKIAKFDGSNVSLVGSGRGVTTIQGDGDLVVNAARFNLERVTIRNTKIRGRLVSLGAGSDIDRSRFADVEFGMASSHVYAARVCVDWCFENCRFNDASDTSRYLKGAWAFKEIGCYSWYNGVGLRINGGTTISSLGCVYEYNTSQAVILSAEARGTINNILFQGTHFESNGTHGGTESVRLETVAPERIRNVAFNSCAFLSLKGAQHVYATAGGGGNIARISFRDVFASDKLINAGFAPIFDNVEMNTGSPPADALSVESLLSSVQRSPPHR
ncbi:MAG: glycosyl hydrolase family 28-related protein [Gemmatimonadaceae bacterium]